MRQQESAVLQRNERTRWIANPPRIPQQIGLCLSGGGFRAAAFHLGVLSYLNRVSLLSKVNMLSTVSGGTITGVAYAVSLIEKRPFSEFFRNFYRQIEEIRLFKSALQNLGAGTPVEKIPSGRRNLITSMAQTYADELFFNSAEGRPYQLKDVFNSETAPLNEVTFNATDFCSGLAFRFQKSRSGTIGNHTCRLDVDDVSEVRLADIVAASSCFPGGFEPMEFPHDFVWPNGRIPDGVRRELGDRSIGLMDGGVYDNQGIDSLLLADSRCDSRQDATTIGADRLDMFIMSDTNQQTDNLYPFPRPAKGGNFWLLLLLKLNPSLGAMSAFGRVIQALCLLTVVAVFWAHFYSQPVFSIAGICRSIFVFGIPLLLAAVTSFAIFMVRKQFQSTILPRIPGVGVSGWKDLRRLKLTQLLEMFSLRASSLLAMASSVFMKRIRQLSYRVIYEDKRYDGKRVSNYIYDLLQEKQVCIAKRIVRRKSFQELSPVTKRNFAEKVATIALPTAALEFVARQAHDTPTMLWFVEPDELPSLVAAGQASICLNLMNWVADTHLDFRCDIPSSGELFELWKQLVEDWNGLVTDPYSVLQATLDRSKFPGSR